MLQQLWLFIGGGYPVDLNKLKRLQEHFKFEIIEDCAHAFGSFYDNTMIGNSGNYCAFSFQAIKHLTTGDGCIVTGKQIGRAHV